MNKNTTLSIAISLALLGGTITSVEANPADKSNKKTKVTDVVADTAEVDDVAVKNNDSKSKGKGHKTNDEPTIIVEPVEEPVAVVDTTANNDSKSKGKGHKTDDEPTIEPVPVEVIGIPEVTKGNKPAKKSSKLDKGPKNKKKLAKHGIDAEGLSDLGGTDVANLPEDAIAEFEADNVEALSEDGAAGLTKKQMKRLGKKAAKGFKKKHIDAMPPETFEGMTGDSLGGLEGDAIQAMDAEQLDAIPDEAIEELSEEDAAEMLANLGDEILADGEEIEGDTSLKAKKIKKFLPPGWLIGKGNMLKRPPAAIIMMPVLALPVHSNAALKMELAIADLNAGFGLGGATGEDGATAIDGMNELIADTGYEIEQTEEGILSVENPDIEGELVFTPDADGMVQGPEDAEPGLGMNEEGDYVLTLEGGEQLPVEPAPKSFEELADNPDVAAVEIGEDSEVTMEIQDETEEDSSVIVGAFDPLVTDAPEGAEPGVHVEGEPGIDEKAVVVYEDGTQQEVNPAVQEPAEFEEAADKVPGVKNVIINADGTVTVILEGNPEVKVTLKPALEITPAEVSEEEEPVTEEPAIAVNDDGTVTFTDEGGDSQDLYIGDVEPVEDTGETSEEGTQDSSVDVDESDEGEITTDV
ncbi:hypothetical protein QUF74_19090 [Candidatus Halobeggiatoa sp. HSG11]|nr:hypothetical protein [Candidatus Halobeggiatoa sp. HSG11]